MGKDHLLQLIKTLSTQEKKTFSNQMNAIPKTKISYAFDLYKRYLKQINKGLTDHQIEAAMTIFLKRKPKLFKNIANIRNQLKEKILSILIGNQLTDSSESKMRYHINIIEFLLRRKQFDQAELAIEKTKRMAIKYDLYKALIEITDLQLYLISKKSGKKDMALLSKLINKLSDYHTLYALELSLKNIFRKLNLIIYNDLLLVRKQSQKLFQDVYAEFNPEKISIKKHEKNKHTKIVSWYYRIKILYYKSTGNYENAYKNCKQQINYFESDSNLISNFETAYVKAICFFTRVCQDTDNTVEMENCLNKTQKLYQSKDSYDALEATCDIGVLHYLNIYQYDRAIEIALFIENEWDTLVSKTIDEKLLWYCHSNLILFWITDDLNKFEHWLNIGLNIQIPKKGKSHYFAIRMFDLINKLDNHNFTTFYSNLDAFQKTLQYNQNFGKFEEIVLSHLRKFYNIFNGNKTINLNKKEKTKLEKENFLSLKMALQKLHFKTSPFNYNESLLWCESHLQNKTIKEVFETQH